LNRGLCFVRARTKDGDWIGGWYGHNSHAAGYPSSTDLYLESSWHMTPDGEFAGRVEQTAGLYIRAEELSVLEFIEASPEEAPQ
jgi:hypothetical protein